MTDIQVAVQEAFHEAIINTLNAIGPKAEAYAKRLAPVRKVFYTGRNARRRTMSKAEIARLPREVKAAIMPNTALWNRTARRGKNVDTAGGFARVRTTTRKSGASEYNPIVSIAKGGRGVRLPYSSRNIMQTGSGRTNPRTGKASAIYSMEPGISHTLLTARGMSELKHADPDNPQSGAFRNPGGQVTLGGALREEIGWVFVRTGPSIYSIEIQSPRDRGGKSAAYSRYVELPTSRTDAQPYLRPTLQYIKRPLVQALDRNLKAIGGKIR